MTYTNFLKITMGLQKASRDLSKLHDMNIDLSNFIDAYHVIISTVLSEVYTEEGIEWLNWFMHDNEYGQKDWSIMFKNIEGEDIQVDDDVPRYGATDKDGNPICYSFESTYKFLKQYRK